MTDHHRRTVDCLDAETLAAFIDGRLDPVDRERTQAHLTECANCYEAFVEATRLKQDVDERAGPVVVRPLWTRRSVWFGALGAVAAAVIAVIAIRPPRTSAERQFDSAMNDLAAAASQTRLTEGRLSGPLNWAPLAGPTRTAVPVAVSPDIELQARRLQELARTFPRALAAQANGTALLALGDPDGAIQVLQSAADVGDPRVQVDLSAALLERSRLRSDRNAAEAAKAAAQMALARDPSNAQAVFNLALATEALGQKDEAIKAWSRYASLDPTSKWAAEARARAYAVMQRKN